MPAFAKGGEYGLAEGRIISFVHPVMMATCFATSLYAGYTGVQWRRLREINSDLSLAKKAAKAAEDAVAKASENEATPPAALVATQKETAALVAALSDEVKALRDGNFKDVHYQLGTILLGLGIPFAIEGPVNTFMRAGKLFPGPHLYAGAAVVSLWALAAAMVPQMQKGKDWARSTHIGLNAASVALFAYYQVPTGIEIAQKVIQNTKFP